MQNNVKHRPGRRRPSSSFALTGGRAAGWVRTYLCDPQGQPIQLVAAQPNLITYQGADILAKLLAGVSGWSLNRMWVEIQSTGFDTVVPSRSDTAASLIAAYTANHDVVRAPVIGSPGFLTSDADVYDHNRVSFWAYTTETTGVVNGLALSGNKVRGAVLVLNPASASGIADDLVFAHTAIASFTVPSGQRVGIEWTITLS